MTPTRQTAGTLILTSALVGAAASVVWFFLGLPSGVASAAGGGAAAGMVAVWQARRGS